MSASLGIRFNCCPHFSSIRRDEDLFVKEESSNENCRFHNNALKYPETRRQDRPEITNAPD